MDPTYAEYNESDDFPKKTQKKTSNMENRDSKKKNFDPENLRESIIFDWIDSSVCLIDKRPVRFYKNFLKFLNSLNILDSIVFFKVYVYETITWNFNLFYNLIVNFKAYI